jgi:hypothetical protein
MSKRSDSEVLSPTSGVEAVSHEEMSSMNVYAPQTLPDGSRTGIADLVVGQLQCLEGLIVPARKPVSSENNKQGFIHAGQMQPQNTITQDLNEFHQQRNCC